MAMSYLVKLFGRVLKWAIYVGLGLTVVVAIVAFFAIRAFILPPSDQFGNVDDEAKVAGLTVADLRGADDEYFVDADKGLLVKPADGADYPMEILQVAGDVGLEPEAVRQAAIRGQNMWMVWTGGNDRFWEFAALNTIGAFDLLKLASSYQNADDPDGSSAYGRFNRFRWVGLINEPCFEQATGPDPSRFGLWLDKRTDDCAPDPFANADPETGYPGAKVGARGESIVSTSDLDSYEFKASLDADGKLPVGSYYGEPTGVMGLRLFPNPDFDAEAAENWDPVKFYSNEDYYNDADLVRPYRVGMSCAFCHVGPNPINPPQNVEEPTFAEMTSNPGAQYYWVDRVFFWDTEPRPDVGTPAKNERNFLFQLFHTNPMGTLDTSLVSTDYMNNPRTMNAVYETRARLLQSAVTGIETLEGGEKNNVQFQDFPATKALASLYDPATGEGASMRVLKDGADSVGALGALNRVYLNIGLFSEEWLLHFRPFLGGQQISPIKIADAQKNSVYWQATEQQSVDLAIFFLVTTRADKLADAPGGPEMLAADTPDTVERGQEVFAENCAACHSDIEKQPKPDAAFGVDEGVCAGGGAGPDYLECWGRYWDWAQSDSFKTQMTSMVKADDFLHGNYLSTERRVPMDLLGVNACSPTATNGLEGDIWDNFTSTTYKNLPTVGEVTVEHPVSGGKSSFQALGNGRGYLRPASLVSLWTSAPYMLNNAVGYDKHYYGPDFYAPVDAAAPATEGAETDGEYAYATSASCPSSDPNNPYMPCVENRVANFDYSIRKMLSPETRRMDTMTDEPVPGYLYRTSAPACLIVPKGYSPKIIQRFSGLLNWIAPWAIKPGGAVEVGPFPADFPINALLNTKILPDNDEDTSLLAHGWKMAKAGPSILSAVKQLGGQCSPDQLADPALQVHAENVVKETGLVDSLIGLSKCPDYVVNKGHNFGSDLNDTDREALIAWLKRF